MWLFHLHSTVENTAFFPVFSLAGSTAKAFFRLSLWNFKEKASTVFYNTAIGIAEACCLGSAGGTVRRFPCAGGNGMGAFVPGWCGPIRLGGLGATLWAGLRLAVPSEERRDKLGC